MKLTENRRKDLDDLCREMYNTAEREVTEVFELDGFEVFNFNVGIPSASITSNGITFNRSVSIKLGFPPYVRLLINRERKQIAIVPCDKSTDQSAAFYRENYEKDPVRSVRWNNRDLMNTLSDLLNCDFRTTSFKVEGKLLNEGPAIMFDLTKAEPMK